MESAKAKEIRMNVPCATARKKVRLCSLAFSSPLCDSVSIVSVEAIFIVCLIYLKSRNMKEDLQFSQVAHECWLARILPIGSIIPTTQRHKSDSILQHGYQSFSAIHDYPD